MRLGSGPTAKGARTRPGSACIMWLSIVLKAVPNGMCSLGLSGHAAGVKFRVWY